MTTSSNLQALPDTTANRTDAILAQLMTELAKPGSSLIPMLNVMRAFPRYSLSNQLLILAQKPTATWVKGYRAWQDAGYQVRKGERGIAIWAPTIRRAKRAASTVPPATPVDHDGPSPEDEAVLTARPRFRVAYVWDVSSCDPVNPVGGETPLATPPSTPAPGPVSAVLHALKSAVSSLGFALEIEAMPAGLYGRTDGRTLTLAAYQDDATTACTLVHELAHALLHFDHARDPRPDLVTRETEAEAVAYVVCETLGIPTASASVDYIRTYRGNPDTLRESLGCISSTANLILSTLVPAWPDPGGG